VCCALCRFLPHARYTTPPGEDFILIKYSVAGLPSDCSNPSLLAFITGAAPTSEGKASVSCSPSGGDVTCTSTTSGQAGALVFGSLGGGVTAFAATDGAGENVRSPPPPSCDAVCAKLGGRDAYYK